MPRPINRIQPRPVDQLICRLPRFGGCAHDVEWWRDHHHHQPPAAVPPFLSSLGSALSGAVSSTWKSFTSHNKIGEYRRKLRCLLQSPQIMIVDGRIGYQYHQWMISREPPQPWQVTITHPHRAIDSILFRVVVFCAKVYEHRIAD